MPSLALFRLRVASKYKSTVIAFVFLSVVDLVCPYAQTADPTIDQIRIERFSKSILAFDIANESDLAAAALSDLEIRVWRLSSGQTVHEFSFPEAPTDQNLKLSDEYEPVSLHFSPNGRTLAVGFLSAIHLYDVETWTEDQPLSLVGESDLRAGIIVTPKTPRLTPRTSEEAKAQSQRPVQTINETMRQWAARRRQGDGRTRIRDFTFSRDGQFILATYCRGGCWWSPEGTVAFASGRDPVRLWQLRQNKIIWERAYDPKGVLSPIVTSLNGRIFLAVDSEMARCAIGAYDLGSGQALWSHNFGPCLHPSYIHILPDDHSFVANRIEEADRNNKDWKYAALYDTSTGNKVADLPKADGISAADVSSDGHWLASITWTGTQFQIWDFQAKKIIVRDVPKGWRRTADCVLNRIRLSPDNNWLVVGCNLRGDLAVFKINH